MWAHLKFVVGDVITNKYSIIKTASGAVSVDVFFVLSGFVIALTSSKGKYKWNVFLIHRIAIVVPIFWLVSIFFIFIDIFNNTFSYRLLWNTISFSPIFDFDLNSGTLHPYGWTIYYEMWFYFSVCLVMIISKNSILKYLILYLFLGVLFLLTLYNGSWFFPRIIFSRIVLEFCLGILIFLSYKRIASSRILAIFFSILSVILFVGVLCTEELGYHRQVLSSSYLSLRRFFIWGGFATVLLMVMIYIENSKIIKFPVWFVSMGDSSYSLYLIQPIFVFFTSNYISEHNWILASIVYVFGTIITSIYIYKFIEKPLTLFVKIKLEALLITN